MLSRCLASSRTLLQQGAYSTRATMPYVHATDALKDPKGKLDVPRPSASIMILSPTNQLLLLHRVRSSSAFASAHVFPGGVLSSFHERVPAIDAPDRHRESETYRIAAIREAFEESGILLAKKNGQLAQISPELRLSGRKEVHGDKVKFTDWLKSIGAEPDLDGLIPFTRWITPFFSNKRYSAQMYLYLLPLDCPPALFDAEHDGGLEHTAAQWDTVSSWLERSHRGDIIVYEPQIFLLTMLSQYLTGSGNYAAEREALLKFIDHIPTGRTPHPTAQISWRDKVIGPYHLPVQLSGGRVALALEDPGPELEGSGRGGDYDRVVVVNTADEGPRQSKVVSRAEVEAEGRAAKL